MTSSCPLRERGEVVIKTAMNAATLITVLPLSKGVLSVPRLWIRRLPTLVWIERVIDVHPDHS